MAPKFGRATHPNRDVVSEIRKAKSLGADFAEITLERPSVINGVKKRQSEIRRELNKHGLFCTAHMAYWIELGTQFDSVRLVWISECRKAIDAMALVGAKKFLVHLRAKGYHMLVPAEKRTIMNNFLESVECLGTYARSKGMELVVENEQIGAGKMKIADFVWLASKLSHSGITFDNGHAFIGNNNSTLRIFIRRLGRNINHVHLSDNMGHDDDHLPIGKGKMNFKMIVSELKKQGFDGTIVLEIFNGGDAGFRSSLRKVKQLWRNA